MKPAVSWTIAALLAVLMLLTGILTGCTKLPEAASSDGVTVYYLYPGEPAPVEGPQMRAADFERLLEAAERNLHSQADKKL
jgi:hypothetical protein